MKAESKAGLASACLLFVICRAVSAVPPDSALAAVHAFVAQADQEGARIRKMAAANTEAEFTRYPRPVSAIGRILYATVAFKLKVAGCDLAVLRGLPKSAAEMEAFYEFTGQAGNEHIQPLYRSFYEAAFQSVATHPDYLHAVFSAATQFDTKRWPDYDDIDWYCSRLARVRRTIPDAYDAAVKREPGKKDRDFLTRCGK